MPNSKFYIKSDSLLILFKNLGILDLFKNYKTVIRGNNNIYSKDLDKEKVAFEYIGLGLMRYLLGKDIIIPKTYLIKDKNNKNKYSLASKVESDNLSELLTQEVSYTTSTVKMNENVIKKISDKDIAGLDVAGAFLGNYDSIGFALHNIRYDNTKKKLYKFDESEAIKDLYRPLSWRIADYREILRNIIMIKSQFPFLIFCLLLMLTIILNTVVSSTYRVYNTIVNYAYPKIKSFFINLNDNDISRLESYYKTYYHFEALNKNISDGKSIYSYIETQQRIREQQAAGQQLPLTILYKEKLKAKDIKERLKDLFKLDNETLYLIINKVPDEFLSTGEKAQMYDILSYRRNLMFRQFGKQVGGEYTDYSKIYQTHPWLNTPSLFKDIIQTVKSIFGYYENNSFWEIKKQFENNPQLEQQIGDKIIDKQFQHYLLKKDNVVRDINDFTKQFKKAKDVVAASSEAELYLKTKSSRSIT